MLYDYQCLKCEHVLSDVFFKTISEMESTKVACTMCGGECEKLISPWSVHADHTTPEWSWKHGKWIKSLKDLDRYEKDLYEPDMEKVARQYAAEDARVAAMTKEEN